MHQIQKLQMNKKGNKILGWAGRKKGKVSAFRPGENEQNQSPVGAQRVSQGRRRAGGDWTGRSCRIFSLVLLGLPPRAGILGECFAGAALFTVGAAERCPEERQQLTGLEKKMASFHKEPFKCVFRAT